jgi:chromosomal replication initiator protein
MVREGLRSTVGDATFNSWLAQLHIVDDGETHITLGARSEFLRGWIDSHYRDTILDEFRKHRPGLIHVQIVAAASAHAATHNAPATPAKRGDGQDVERLGAPLDHGFTFENFVVGRPNELAHAAAQRAANAETPPFNPFFLHGAVGLGKTHLMHAIAWRIRERAPEKKVLYLSAEKFMVQFIAALRFKNTMDFKERFRNVDVLMVDDVQFIAGKDSTQEEFFHTFNALVDERRMVVVSADRSPADLEGIQERIRSRLGWGLVADIHATDFELRLGVLHNKADAARAEHGDLPMDERVLPFLAEKITSNVRELEGAFNRLVAHAVFVNRKIDLDSARDLLSDLLRASERRVTVEEIQRHVCEHYNLRKSDLLSDRRSRAIARPRQVAMYLAKHLTTRSLPDIGRRFGGRDHTTVMHAVKKISELYESDAAVREDVDILRCNLVG